MTLNPITVVDQAIDENRSYLSTEFQARDPQLREALEAALVEAGFLAQEPFFQAHRPFKSGRRWRELGLDAALARVTNVTMSTCRGRTSCQTSSRSRWRRPSRCPPNLGMPTTHAHGLTPTMRV